MYQIWTGDPSTGATKGSTARTKVHRARRPRRDRDGARPLGRDHSGENTGRERKEWIQARPQGRGKHGTIMWDEATGVRLSGRECVRQTLWGDYGSEATKAKLLVLHHAGEIAG